MTSYSLLRRYTPPTCTLEITAKSSPLSFWTETTLVKDLRFVLRFDDPKLPEEQQLLIKGSRDELEIINEVVNDYIQELLISSPEISKDKEILPDNSSKPFFRPQGLLSHDLFLGSLVGQNQENKIRLSVTQLYDLANALEQYNTELATLPELEKIKAPQSNVVKSTQVAALVLALGIGTTSILHWQKSSQESASVASYNTAEASNLKPETAKIPKLTVPRAPKNTPIPAPSLPGLLSQKSPLPVPAPVTPPDTNSWVTARAINEPKRLRQSEQKPTSNIPSFSNNPTSPSKKQDLKLDTLPNLQPSPRAKVAIQDNQQPPKDLTPIEEVKTYFQQRWLAPKDLSQALEYRLLINSDGSVKDIIPLKAISTNYMKQAPMPLKGQKLMSTPPTSDLTIRLVLNTDSTVATFLESK